MEKIKQNFLPVCIGIAILIFASFGITTVETTPDHSLIFISEQNKEYISPPCLMKAGYDNVSSIKSYARTNNIELVTRGEIKGRNFKPFGQCVEQNGFTESSSFGSDFLKLVGFSNDQSRWNDDGSWNY